MCPGSGLLCSDVTFGSVNLEEIVPKGNELEVMIEPVPEQPVPEQPVPQASTDVDAIAAAAELERINLENQRERRERRALVEQEV